MTIERRLARAGFTLTRDYPVALEHVWDAFADEEQKLQWWGAGDAIEPGEWAFDFRVGGRDIAEGKFHEGPVSRYEATYTDIVEHVRIVTTYDMWIDGTHMSTSVASLEFDSIDDCTRFTHVEDASTSTNSGPTDPTARKAAGAYSTLWATISRDPTSRQRAVTEQPVRADFVARCAAPSVKRGGIRRSGQTKFQGVGSEANLDLHRFGSGPMSYPTGRGSSQHHISTILSLRGAIPR